MDSHYHIGMQNSWKATQSNRLLTEVKNRFPNFSTKDVRWSIEHHRCFVNNRVETFSSKQLERGDEISIFLEKQPLLKKEISNILFEDESLLLYNKPPYLTSESLAEMLNCHLVHRLDRDTSGLILLAKSQHAKYLLEEMFKKREIKKEYFALVKGIPMKTGGEIIGKMCVKHRREGAVVWGMAKKGLWSKTSWKLIAPKKDCSLLLCKPITGRTHQIRVHLKELGHPILGDFVYGSRERSAPIFRPLLHAAQIEFAHPYSQDKIILSSPLPKDFNL